ALGLQTDSAGNGVCDVEPLSVDEAIVILRDPLGSLVPEFDDPVAVGYPAEFFGRQQIEAPNYYLYFAAVRSDSYAVAMQSHQFAKAQLVINEYLDCMQTGTVGQEWRLMNPVTVQFRIASALPTLTSEEEARELLPELLSQPATFAPMNPQTDIVSVFPRLNPDVEQTRYFAATDFIGFSGYAISPVQFVDSSGAVKMEADLQGRSLSDPGQMEQFSMNVIYGQSSLDLEWYVIDIVFPFNLPVG
ncbi:MAG: hypothetical protein M9950_13560, partial [Thermomicrobiales bacterium]|nr:hypothetical protein [Thermomicrobiales bacterium]